MRMSSGFCALSILELYPCLPMYLGKPFVGYHWSGIRWLIIFVQAWMNAWMHKCSQVRKMFAFLTVSLRNTLVLLNGEEVGLLRSATESELMY